MRASESLKQILTLIIEPIVTAVFSLLPILPAVLCVLFVGVLFDTCHVSAQVSGPQTTLILNVKLAGTPAPWTVEQSGTCKT